MIRTNYNYNFYIRTNENMFNIRTNNIYYNINAINIINQQNDTTDLINRLNNDTIRLIDDALSQIRIGANLELKLERRECDEKEKKEDCCICLASLEEKKYVSTLKCNHTFHHECITEWTKTSYTCPLCRISLVEREENNH